MHKKDKEMNTIETAKDEIMELSDDELETAAGGQIDHFERSGYKLIAVRTDGKKLAMSLCGYRKLLEAEEVLREWDAKIDARAKP